MSGWNEEMLLALAPTPWQPLSARKEPRHALPTGIRGAVLGMVAFAHVLAVLGLMALLERRQRAVEDAIHVDFIDEPATVVELPPLPNETITIRAPKPHPTPTPPRREPRSRKPAPVDAPPSPVDFAMRVESPAKPGEKSLQLFNPDGSLRVPEDMLDNLDKQFGDKRTFSFQIPRFEDADKYFKRHPALVYEETRFDRYWTPEGDILTSFLQQAVDATTKEVKMKIPGSNSYVVCKISILAAGGACGVLTPGADWNGPQDDPNTLNPEEDRQCAAWWRKIVQAKTQDAWHATRKLYEAACRKPLERKPSG